MVELNHLARRFCVDSVGIIEKVGLKKTAGVDCDPYQDDHQQKGSAHRRGRVLAIVAESRLERGLSKHGCFIIAMLMKSRMIDDPFAGDEIMRVYAPAHEP